MHGLPATVADYLLAVSVGESLDDLSAEPWFQSDDPLPAAPATADLADIISVLMDVSFSANIRWGPIRSVVVPAPRFNRLLGEWRVKSGVNASAIIALLNNTLDLPGEDAIHVDVDKLGGRHFYAPLAQRGISRRLGANHP